jgi:hypothetical protein
MEEAQARLPGQTDSDEMARLQEEAEAKLADLRAEIDALNDAMHLEIVDIYLPEVVVPDAEIATAPDGWPPIDSDDSWARGRERGPPQRFSAACGCDLPDLAGVSRRPRGAGGCARTVAMPSAVDAAAVKERHAKRSM